MKLAEICNTVIAEGSSAFAEAIAVLEPAGTRYTVIGSFAINAYVDPVFTR